MGHAAPDSVRYPIGRHQRLASYSPATRKEAIAILESLPAKLATLVEDWVDDQFDTPYREGGWTVRQLIHHVADSHINAYVRVRLALTEDNPTIIAYEEKAWAQLADAQSMPVSVSLDLLYALHARWVALLRSLNESQWQRAYVHPVNGPTTIDQALDLYAWHSRHHAAHISALAEQRDWQR